MKSFKISCHAIGEIMAGSVGLTEVQAKRLDELSSRKKDHAAGVDKAKPLTDNMVEELNSLIKKRDNPELPDGAKTYLKKWLKKKLFNRSEDFKSIKIEKGLACEPMGITLVNDVYELNCCKNDEFFEHHDFIQGSPDIIEDTQEIVRDIKSSWDLFTFPMFENELPDTKYWWQLQGYMILTGMRKACIDYALIDTPMPLILQDLKKVFYQSGGKPEDWTPDQYEELYPNYQFGDIPSQLRVKTFKVDFDAIVESKIIERVEMCRQYLKSIMPKEFLEAA